VVIEEDNLRENILLNTIDQILNNEKRFKEMQMNNLKFFKSDAAEIIAKEIVKIGLSHNY